jgi:hypothetical protein
VLRGYAQVGRWLGRGGWRRGVTGRDFGGRRSVETTVGRLRVERELRRRGNSADGRAASRTNTEWKPAGPLRRAASRWESRSLAGWFMRAWVGPGPRRSTGGEADVRGLGCRSADRHPGRYRSAIRRSLATAPRLAEPRVSGLRLARWAGSRLGRRATAVELPRAGWSHGQQTSSHGGGA